jgi:cobalamin synthase
MEQEKAVLKVIGAVGYLNLTMLVYALFSLKTTHASWPMVLISPAVSLIGTAIYCCFWDHLFSSIRKQEGRRFMRPYILGFTITVSATLLVYGLAFLAEHRVP